MMVRHVILITYGEPPGPDFLPQLTYSWRILLGLTRTVAAIPKVLLPILALYRGVSRTWMWSREEYGSPLESITHAQASGLAEVLRRGAPDVEWRVHVAYEFRDPSLEAVLDRLEEDEPVDIIPMYVADSAFTHGISRMTVREWAEKREHKRTAPVRVLPPIDAETFAEISARHVVEELSSRGVMTDEKWGLMLVAHGTLLEPSRPMETGREETEKIGRAIAERLDDRFGHIEIGWLNHTRGGRWTEPPAHQALERIARAGVRRVVYYPFGFSTDNAESELEGRQVLRTQPSIEAVHLRCPNTNTAFLNALASCVLHATADRDPRKAVNA